MPSTLYEDRVLGFQIKYLPRWEWGSLASTETFISNRVKAPPSSKICYQIHHTAGIDDDDNTPNMRDLDEAIAYQKKLQWSRPDLGPLPYPENAAISEDMETVWLLEGRGFFAVGAHTADHNYHGQALGWQGNFDLWTPERALQLAVATVQWRFNNLRRGSFPNLGTERSPRSWLVWGHRDSTNKSCPGNLLYPRLSLVRSVDKEEDDMWDWITVDESLVRHASRNGWYKKPDGSPDYSDSTLNYFLTNLANGNLKNPAWGDYANWRKAVANGMARSGVGISPGELVRIVYP